ncbi:hypothetical protein DPMN_149535 [Dreissena polymorpha]|uniref:Uncharacterized protein n=1 Tax=Dreissena polymorpha TaxID=45954 RepID=A0A9D4FCW1_DREPO|nr:hypothetical protein DPMN_149535 [Dreissena polymorpha]
MTAQHTFTRQNKSKASSQSDHGNQRTPGIKTNPESRSSRRYSPGNQTSDLTKSGLMSDQLSSSTHQLAHGYQQSAVYKPD